MLVVKLVLLLTLANSAPVMARHALGDLWQQPIDGGLVLRDGRRLFGRSKTWRGLLAASAACGLAAPLLGLPWRAGLGCGALAMTGDLLASFVKRRLGLAAGARAPRLDSLPEALLPTWALQDEFGLSGWQVAAAVVCFVLTVRLASPLLFRLRLRPRPW